MLFQIIDNKQQCTSIYSNNQIISEPEYNKLSKTWSYNSILKDQDIKYAYLYAQGQNLDQCCPDILKDKWEPHAKAYEDILRAEKSEMAKPVFRDEFRDRKDYPLKSGGLAHVLGV